MKIYMVTIRGDIEVEAENESDALEKAQTEFDIFDMDDFRIIEVSNAD